jgi:serine/threonine-protein kinase
MSLAPGARLGPYEILAAIGAGGMGEVYRARDTKLDRGVAIKILPDAFAADPERVARFQREAKTLASLNHPHIAAIYGLEDSDGVKALVLELVEGPTLADRIARGPIPLDEALPIARQIAEALEAAHEAGIIHRDLKPANIKLRPDGTVKVLDFGLAKAMEPAGASANLSMSPTITSPAMTQAGIILGTAAYMSPEQARGKSVDRRADIWAFGCVLFEMITGKRSFGGGDVADTFAAVLRSDPDWAALPPETPAVVRRLLRRCIAKERKGRIPDIGAVRLEIEDMIATRGSSSEESLTARPQSPWRRSLPVTLIAGAAGASVAGLAVAISIRTAPSSPRPTIRFGIELPAGDTLSATSHQVAVISPNGTHLVYVANEGLYLRALDQPGARPITGTFGGAAVHARNPFFSPDGQWIGFWHNGQLKKVSVTGGAPVPLCPARSVLGASWEADNTIVFAEGTAGILRVSASGGAPEVLIAMDAGQSAAWPEILPGGRAVLFTLASGANWSDAQIVVQSLETGSRQVLIQGSHARYAMTGHLVYGFQESLLAAPFDLASLRVAGVPVTLVPGIGRDATTGVTQFSWSDDGTLVYIAGSDISEQRRLVWVDRKGQTQPIDVATRGYIFPRLSPDGQKIAVSTVAPTPDVWVYDVPRGTLTRLTSAGINTRNLWTPDGTRVTFASDRAGGSQNIYWIPADGSTDAERLTTSSYRQVPESWAPDGKTLAFSELDPDTNWDIWTLLLPDRKTELLLRTPFHDGGRAFSPDGRWLAYYSDESGRGEVFVRGYRPPGGKWPISSDGGAEPVWSRDGREIFYRSGNKLMAVDVMTGSTFLAGKPKPLFEGPYVTALPANFDVSPDGQRFVMVIPVQKESRSARFDVVLNWFEELKRLVPIN